jgi:hypothetical protein
MPVMLFLSFASFGAEVTYELSGKYDNCNFDQSVTIELNHSRFSEVKVNSNGCADIPAQMSFKLEGTPYRDSNEFLIYKSNFNSDGWTIEVQDRSKSSKFLSYNNRAALSIKLINKDGDFFQSFSSRKKICKRGVTSGEVLGKLQKEVEKYTSDDSRYIITPISMSFNSSYSTASGRTYSNFKGCQYVKEENLEKINPPQASVCFRKSYKDEPVDKKGLKNLLTENFNFINPKLINGWKSQGAFFNGYGAQYSCWVGRDLESYGLKCGFEIAIVCAEGYINGCNTGETSYHKCVPVK